MDMSIANEVIRVIREERNKRLAALETEDDPRMAEDLWYRNDEPFINELCLMLLVAIRHEIERELTLLIAQKTSKNFQPVRGPGDPIDPVGRKLRDGEYMEWVEKERKRLEKLVKRERSWKGFYSQLGLGAETEHWLETLRHLSNSYKHDPWNYKRKFLEHLGLSLEKNYMALAESPAIREALAKDLELTSEADYCDIGEAFLNRASDLISKLEGEFGVRYFLVSPDPKDFGA